MNPQTQSNVNKALNAEAMAFAKYMMFAKRARQTGRNDLAKMFTEIANIELNDHFSTEWELLGKMGENEANLEEAVRMEMHDIDVMYRQFIEQAIDAGEQEMVDRFTEIRRDETKHRDRFLEALKKEKERT